ncbi:uncharacterized protein LOC118413811 [Branchiostoma floridae]|uniref:Uncharacterized protein LOC118413811 n=1 Tax=Branchiostoma floridae TaxID=7739 RepID=A0A9J7KZJ4_BRAFL|nr:uncharacterized protein LOC118413811 [Branchiostoma floridae]
MADNDFRWGQITYTLREFLDSFTLPRIVKVTDGHYGNTEVESLAAGQIVRIHRQVRQLRVIAEDRHGRRLSIPADRKGVALFDVVSGGRVQEFDKDIVDILQTHTLPLRAQFSREIGLRSTDRHGVQMFGELTLLETYEEKYLQGNSYSDSTLVETVLLIPMYLTLRVAVAEGLLRGGDSDWTSLCQALSHTADTVSFDDVVGNEDVSLYTKTSVEEHNHIYDEIEPTRILKVYAVRDLMSSEVLDVGKTYAPLPPAPDEKEKKGKKKEEKKKAPPPVPLKPKSLRRPAGIPLPGLTPQSLKGQTDKPQQDKRPVVQRRPAIGQPSTDSYQTLVFDDPSTTCYQGLYMEGEAGAVQDTAASSHTTGNVAGAVSTPGMPRVDEAAPSRKPLLPPPAGGVPTAVVFASPSVTHAPKPKDETTSTPTTKENLKETDSAQKAANPSSSAGRRFSAGGEQLGVFIETFSDIPKDMRTITIAQMADCLRLLKLDKYIATFEENMVDGDLLMDLDKAMMRNDLNMSPLDCVKLLKFRDEGWRPKDQ